MMSKRDRFPPLRPQEPAPPVWREWLADGIGALCVLALVPALLFLGCGLTDQCQPQPMEIGHE